MPKIDGRTTVSEPGGPWKICVLNTNRSMISARPSVVSPRKRPFRLSAGYPAARPASTAAPAPTSMASSTGRWSDTSCQSPMPMPSPFVARAVKNAPSPAMDACPSVRCPENPVMHTIETKMTARAKTVWARRRSVPPRNAGASTATPAATAATITPRRLVAWPTDAPTRPGPEEVSPISSSLENITSTANSTMLDRLRTNAS